MGSRRGTERDLHKTSTIMASMHLKVPFVVTIAAAAAACGGTTVMETGSGGQRLWQHHGHDERPDHRHHRHRNTLECPTSPPDGYTQCDPGPGVCTYDVACQSGTVALSFTCTEGWWELEPTACEQPYGLVSGTQYYCNGEWTMPQGTNPPSPCPDTRPPAGEPASPVAWAACGKIAATTAGRKPARPDGGLLSLR